MVILFTIFIILILNVKQKNTVSKNQRYFYINAYIFFKLYYFLATPVFLAASATAAATAFATLGSNGDGIT